ncbi:MAG TPA: hypothetical protein VGS41_12890 [Chthonomonadales bacterium]|nr:hypothetical protein [Chthonomonadales bacterium]
MPVEELIVQYRRDLMLVVQLRQDGEARMDAATELLMEAFLDMAPGRLPDALAAREELKEFLEGEYVLPAGMERTEIAGITGGNSACDSNRRELRPRAVAAEQQKRGTVARLAGTLQE